MKKPSAFWWPVNENDISLVLVVCIVSILLSIKCKLKETT